MDYKKVADRLYDNLMVVVSDSLETDKELAMEIIEHDLVDCINDPNCEKWTRFLVSTPNGYTVSSMLEFIRQFKFDFAEQNEKLAVFLGKEIDDTKTQKYCEELAVRLDSCLAVLETAYNMPSYNSRRDAENVLYDADESIISDMYPNVSGATTRLELFLTKYLNINYFCAYGNDSQLRMLKAFRQWLHGIDVPEGVFTIRDDTSSSGVVYVRGVEIANMIGGVVDFSWGIEYYDDLIRHEPHLAKAFMKIPSQDIHMENAKTYDDLLDTATILGVHPIMITAVQEKVRMIKNKYPTAKRLFDQLLNNGEDNGRT